MKLFSWIRSYYIYFYYYHAIRSDGEKPFKPRGFIATTLLVTSFNMITIFLILGAIYPVNVDFLRAEIINVRGPISPLFLILIGFGSIATYFMCCYKVEFEEIEHRLSNTPGLRERSNSKLVSLFFLSVVLTVITGPLFH